ncbi:thioredoxin domain-containing protein [Euzebyella marina]|uniref:Thioredoxin domain-containing protein n=1 Tax=Euzebyella marina TaxID=1761453 RepID=A0A3G2L5F9_9FLAO|nr:thioredoxin domain-containing protein [Euzebyella marina]AYN67421.1 thioredoxin domain-containing protein [Euzebyella marina]
MKVFRFFFPQVILFAFLILASCKEEKNDVPVQEEHKYTNELANETSPYLLQHAHNPVNWRPWGQEPLNDAKKENKLVLVSIGYSSCHWCHVMEEETFEDEEVAKVMNENFVSIKVDREERPDVDQIYMTALQLISGNGGWPLNVITLPNGKPLYGGTYHTKEQWTQVLTKINDLYKNDPKKAEEYADMVAAGIAEANTIVPTNKKSEISKTVLVENVEKWKKFWDLEKGGDQGTQKFMIPVNLMFLLDYAILENDVNTRSHVKTTLDKMLLGGVYDHVAGGFFRYSTDADWKIPHFEKMLYDNAQALSLYSKAYTVFGDVEYQKLVSEMFEFLQREMKGNSEGYYAALDADTEGEEGKFYVWEQNELKKALGSDFDLFAKYYSVNEKEAWEENKYVLRRNSDDVDFLESEKMDESKLSTLKQEWKNKLLNARNTRPRPGIDDKVITSWNALLINGLVDAYKAFGQQKFLTEAEKIFQFLENNSFKNGRLVHTYKEGSSQNQGFLEDYSYLANAALQLYSVTFDEKYHDFADRLTKEAYDRFFDDTTGMFFYNESDELIAKIVKTDDGVLPSPNAVMAKNLFLLGHIDYNKEYLESSKQMLASMQPLVAESPASYSKWNALSLNNVYPYFEIAVVGKDVKPVINGLNQKYLPNTLIVGSDSKSELPLFEDRFIDGETYIYVCQNTTCKLPVKTVNEALNQMANF